MPCDLNIFMRNKKIFTSLTASFLPDDIPYKPAWDPRDDHNSSLDDTTSPLTTRWAYAAHPWFPLVPLNPSFNGPIFECLNHSMFSLCTELNSQGKHILHHDIRESWVELEKKLLWCQELLGAGLLVPWETKLPCPPAQYGYQRSHSDAKLTKKVALKSHNAFLLIATALLIDNSRCPIPAEWVHKLSHSFVGDISTKVPCTGTFISSIHCPWELQLPMFKHFSIPIWVHIKQVAVFDVKLRHYNPSKEAIARAIEAQHTSNSAWGQNDSAWGKDDGSQSQSALGWDGSTLGWDDSTLGCGPAPEAPQVDPCFPVPEQLSGQKSGEDWKTFFAHRLEENKKKQAKESPAQWQSRKS
ncbi:hypothetical protein BD769DRAFT_1675188 [Suillus cothurnatus]|nr:hypothetical protein BD769DRAFT_1675188 [Suillus cothurnatus]